MKKNLIALAVAGALVAPVAMAEVTVTGGLQAELVSVGGDGATTRKGLYANDAMTFEAGENKGNFGYLKFAASEDLGGGMKALAVYNMATNVGDEKNAVGTRDAYVGLSTGVGTFLAGTLATPYKSSTVNYDPFLATSFQARDNYGMSMLHNGYAGNAVAYANTFMGGMMKLVAAVVLDEGADQSVPPSTTKTNGKHAKSFSLNIAPMSGLDVAIAYMDVSEFSDACNLGVTSCTAPTTLPLGKDYAATKIGAKYTMGALSVAAQVEMLDKGFGDDNVTYLTASYKMDDSNSVSASYGKTGKDLVNGVDDGTYMAVGLNHAFSKNTSATIGYRASEDAVKETAVGAGLRVNF